MTSDMNPYPVRYDVEYPEGKRNRLTALFRIILVIPALVIAALVTAAAGALTLATALMILFRRKYPRAWVRLAGGDDPAERPGGGLRRLSAG